MQSFSVKGYQKHVVAKNYNMLVNEIKYIQYYLKYYKKKKTLKTT